MKGRWLYMAIARNTWLGIGRWTKDCELKTLSNENQTKMFRNTLAISNGKDKNGDELPSDFINVTAYGKNAENLAKFTQKGSKVAIQGELKTGSYDDKDGNKVYTWGIRVDSFELLEGKKDGNNQSQNNAPAQQNAQSAPAPEAPTDNFMSTEGIEDQLPSGWGV